MNENTQKGFTFTIEGELFNLPDEKVTAKSIIELVKKRDIPSAKGEVENLILESNGTVYSSDDLIDLSENNNFSIRVKEEEKTYQFKVNGQEFESESRRLIVLEIIKIVQEKGVNIPGKPEDVLLQVVGEQYPLKNDAWVDLEKITEFIIILNKSTPVALRT